LSGIASLLSISGVLSGIENIVVPILLISSILLIVFIVANRFRINLLTDSINERREFIAFIQYLLDNPDQPFNLLPKICLLVDKENRLNNLHIRDMSINCTCDMNNVDILKTPESEDIEYISTVEYNFEAEYKSLPSSIVWCSGHMRADSNPVVKYIYGNMKEPETIEYPKDGDKKRIHMDACLHEFPLDHDYIPENKPLSISLILEHRAKSKTASSNNVIFYPYQFASKIEKVNFNVKFRYTGNVMMEIESYEIKKEERGFKQNLIKLIPSDGIIDNKVSIPKHIGDTKHKAYYVNYTWKLL
jgi:hypothetical protein